jgi:hypothetical protein
LSYLKYIVSNEKKMSEKKKTYLRPRNVVVDISWAVFSCYSLSVSVMGTRKDAKRPLHLAFQAREEAGCGWCRNGCKNPSDSRFERGGGRVCGGGSGMVSSKAKKKPVSYIKKHEEIKKNVHAPRGQGLNDGLPSFMHISWATSLVFVVRWLWESW